MTLPWRLVGPAGGMLMLAAFFLPWGTTSLMGLDTLTFTARDLAEHDAGWYLLPFCAVLAIVVGVAELLAGGPERARVSVMFGAASLMFSLIAGIFVVRVLLALAGDGIRLDWLEGVTAADLNLHRQPGVPLVLAGSVLGALGGLLTVRAAKATLR